MVVLQHGVVVVEQCQLMADVDEELVGLARVSHVVDGRRHQCCQHLHRGEDTLCVCVGGGGGGRGVMNTKQREIYFTLGTSLDIVYAEWLRF